MDPDLATVWIWNSLKLKYWRPNALTMLTAYAYDQLMEQDASMVDPDIKMLQELGLFPFEPGDGNRHPNSPSESTVKSIKIEGKISKTKRYSKFDNKNKRAEKEPVKKEDANEPASPSSCSAYIKRELTAVDSDSEPAYERSLKRFIARGQPFITNYESLIGFPHGLIHCLNSGDFQGLWHLVSGHLERNCSISLSYNKTTLSGYSFVRLFEILNDVHPDRIMSVHTSEFVNNEVVATVYVKFTDSKPLYESVARTVNDPAFVSFFPNTRAACLKRKMHIETRPEQERKQLSQLLDSDSDLVIYGCVQIRLKTDVYSRKGVDFKMLCNYTSIHPTIENLR